MEIVWVVTDLGRSQSIIPAPKEVSCPCFMYPWTVLYAEELPTPAACNTLSYVKCKPLSPTVEQTHTTENADLLICIFNKGN